jgi:S-layer protein
LLTAGVDAPAGTTGNDTFNASGTTFTSLDAINGGAGTDTLLIVDTAGVLGTAPSSVTLSSIEAMSISTTGDLGVAAGGVTAQAQKNTYVVAATDAGVKGVSQITMTGNTAASDPVLTVTYNGTTQGFATDTDVAATTATNLAAAINTAAGATVAYVGVATKAPVADVAAAATSFALVNADATGVQIGMAVVGSTSGDVAAGTYVTNKVVGATNTTITISQAIPAGKSILAASESFTFGGGAGAVTVTGQTGQQPSFGFSNSTNIAVSTVVTADASNIDDVVTANYGGLTRNFLIGATATATGDNMVAAINALAGATIAVNTTGTVVVTAPTAGTALPAITFSGSTTNLPSVTYTQANRVATAVEAAAYDVSGMTADAVNVVMADSANLKAAATSDVNVSGVTGAIVVDGGKNINVTDASADSDITVGATTVPKGTVTVNATKAGASSVAVDGGTNVTVNVTGSSGGADSITVGNGGAATDLPTGAVVVTSAHTGVAATNVALNSITVKGGTTVVVTQTADTSKVADDTTGQTLTQGAVSVTGGAATTSIEINQVAAATANAAVKAVAAKAGSQKVTFIAASAGDKITITTDTNKSITFTAAKALTALEVAQAFANLAKSATDGASSVINGVYSNGSSGGFSNDWISGAAVSESTTTASVTFTTDKDLNGSTAGLGLTSSNDLEVAHVDSGNTSVSGIAKTAVVDGNVATLAETGKLGVVAGAATVNGAITGTDVLTTVTLNSYGTSTVASDALTTLNLSNADASLTATTASTGSVTINLNKVAGSSAAVSLDGGSAATVTGVTINATGTKSDLTVTANAATAVAIAAAVDLDLTDSSFDAAKTITITGAGKVVIDEAGTSTALTVLEKIDASGNTGGVNVKDTMGAADQFIGGAGADTFALASSATKASSGGAGNDVITAVSFGTGGSVDAGEGTDTLVMAAADAATQSASAGAGALFMTKATNFEKLSIGAVADASGSTDTVTVDLAALTYTDITSAGATDGDEDVLALSNAASGVLLNITAEGLFTIAVASASTGTADVVNLATDVDGNLTIGKVTTANVETVNLSAVDKVVDVSGAFDEFGTAIGDGKDDTNSEQSITLDIDEATTLNITGSADLTVDILDTNNSGADIVTTLVDASAFTGKLTLIADGKISGTTVKGGSGADTLTADGDNDVLIGGAGNDKLTATTLSTLTGGEGNDTFVLTGTVGATVFSTITDLSAGDVIDTAATGFTSTKVNLSNTATFVDYLNTAVAAQTTNSTVQALWFQFGGNTYLVIDGNDSNSNSATYEAAEDAVIGITGLVDLSKAEFNVTTGDLTIL